MKCSFIAFVLLSLSIFSCEDDFNVYPLDDIAKEPTKTYFPYAMGNNWIYGSGKTINGEKTTSKDTTYIDGSKTVNGKTYRKWFQVNNELFWGDTILVRKQSNLTYFLPDLINLGLPQELELADLLVIKDDSSIGNELSNITFDQKLPAINLPDTIAGTVTPTIKGRFISSHTNSLDTTILNGSQTYFDVYKTEVGLTIEIDVEINITFQGIPITLKHTIIPEQVFGDVSLYFANNIGLVRSEFNYELTEIDTTIEVPVLGEINLADFGVDINEILNVAKINGVAELGEYNVTL